MEKIVKPMSGFFCLAAGNHFTDSAGYFFAQTGGAGTVRTITVAILSLLAGIFLLMGIIVVAPNYSRVLTFLANM